MKNIKQTILFLSILFCSLSQVNAQLMGYGSGTYTPSNFIHNTGTLYTDNNRAKGINFTSTAPTTANIDLINFHGTINNGDKLLIIQMKGMGIGTHQAVVVTAITGSTYSIQSVSSQLMLNYNTSAGNDRVQVIKITEYYDFTLNGGIVTCDPWDDADGSGGILALMVQNNLKIYAGVISVLGKGFSPDEAGISWGIGSTGGAANTTINLKNAVKSPPSVACMDGYGTVSVNKGDKGGTVGSSASLGTVNTGTPIYYGGANKNTLLVMGDPGYYQTSYGGARGGQGGGWGGQGANSNCPIPNTGIAGIQGLNGLIGGNAGKGGHGGGAMIIKAFKVFVYTSAVVFDASGEAGQPGGNGGYGGAGGVGGDGGPGCCINGGTTPIPQGGIGGFGDTGAGGNGGDAGNGGACGYIWIGTSKFTAGASPRAKNFGCNAGKGGKAGFGGWSAINTTPNNMSAKNVCSGINCSTTGTGAGCISNVCNPDYAMCLLASTTTSGNLITGTTHDYEFVNASAPSVVLGKYISKNTTGDGDLEMYSNNSCSTTTTYKAICVGDCDILFKQIAQKENVNTAYLPTLPVSGTTCSTTLSFPFNISFIDQASGNIPLLAFNHSDLNTPATLTDISGGSDNVGTFTSCFSLQGPNDGEEYTASPYNPVPVQAPAGNPGVPGPTPTPPPATGGGNPTDNVVIDENNGVWKYNTSTNDKDLPNAWEAQVFPNPAINDLNITLQSDMNTTAIWNMKDINGKEIITSQQKLQTGKNKFVIDISKINAGFYFVTITANNKQSVLKVTVQ